MIIQIPLTCLQDTHSIPAKTQIKTRPHCQVNKLYPEDPMPIKAHLTIINWLIHNKVVKVMAIRIIKMFIINNSTQIRARIEICLELPN